MGQNTNNNKEEKKNENEVQLNPKEPENLLNEKGPINFDNKFQSNILDDKKLLFPDPTNRSEKNIIKSDINNTNENAENKIFNVIYRHTHDGQAKDNIKQTIVTSFINFLLNFINNIIFKKLYWLGN